MTEHPGVNFLPLCSSLLAYVYYVHGFVCAVWLPFFPYLSLVSRLHLPHDTKNGRRAWYVHLGTWLCMPSLHHSWAVFWAFLQLFWNLQGIAWTLSATVATVFTNCARCQLSISTMFCDVYVNVLFCPPDVSHVPRCTRLSSHFSLER